MEGIPSVRRKGFIIQRFDDGMPLRADAEHCENPRYYGLPGEIREAAGDLDGIKLTLPDGGEWWISDKVMQDVLDLTRASRAHFAKGGANSSPHVGA